MSNIDRILDAIDTGLQTAGDASYGHDREGVCWRCQHTTTIAADETCEPCRLDLTVGPRYGPWLPGGWVSREMWQRAVEVFANDEVIEFAHHFGLELDDWQAEVIRSITTVEIDQRRFHASMMYSAYRYDNAVLPHGQTITFTSRDEVDQ